MKLDIKENLDHDQEHSPLASNFSFFENKLWLELNVIRLITEVVFVIVRLLISRMTKVLYV